MLFMCLLHCVQPARANEVKSEREYEISITFCRSPRVAYSLAQWTYCRPMMESRTKTRCRAGYW